MSASAPAASKTTKNALVLIIASILSQGILFVWSIGLQTVLGPEMNGVYGTVLSLMAVSTAVVNFGLGVILIRDVAREPHRIGQYWTATLFLQTVLGLLAYILALGVALFAGYDDMILGYTAIGGLSLLIDIFGTMSSDLLIAQERMALKSAIEIGHIIMRVLLAAVFLALGWGLLGVYIATLITGVIRSVLFWSTHTLKGFWPTMPLDRALTWRLFRDASPLAIAAFFNLMYQHIDKLITTWRLGTENTGYLGPAFTISQGVITVLNTTILIALFPYMSRQFVNEPREYAGRVSTLLRLIFVLSLPIALTITLFAEPIILMIFKAQYAPTIGVLRILIWFTFLTMVGNVLVQAMQVQNRQRRVLWIRASGLAINAVLTTTVLTLFRDPQGAALSAVLSETLVLSLLFAQFRAMEWDTRQGLLYVARVILIAIVTGIVMVVIGQVHFLVGIPIGLAVYAALIWSFGLFETDRALMRQILAIIPGYAWVQRRWAVR